MKLEIETTQTDLTILKKALEELTRGCEDSCREWHSGERPPCDDCIISQLEFKLIDLINEGEHHAE